MSFAASGGIEGDTLLPGDIVNVTVANATLPETRQRVVDAAGSVIQDGKDAASGLLTGVQSWFNHSSTLNSKCRDMFCSTGVDRTADLAVPSCVSLSADLRWL